MKPKWLILGAKNCPTKDMEAKSARTHVSGSKNSLPERSWRASGAKKNLVASKSGQEEFQSDFGKKLDPAGTWSAVLAGPVKAYPGGFRPGKTMLNDFRHAHHRKRWSAD